MPLDLHVVGVMHEVDPAAIIAEAERMPVPSENAHAVAYVSQDQPFTSWRFAVDPHIAER